MIGWSFATTSVLAAEPEVIWPQEWTVFGPVHSKTAGTSLYGMPRKQDLLPGDALRTIAQELVIDGRRYQGQKFSPEKGVLNLGRMLSCAADGTGAYLLAPLTALTDTTVQIGAGADWWMQWWLDGRPIFDTLGNGHAGNGATPVTGRDHLFAVKLTKGQHVLAVAVFGYRQFLLALTSPQELRERPVVFQEAMASGRRKCKPPHWSIAVSHATARTDFERAVTLAATDVEQAEARLAVANSYLFDAQNLSATHATTIRQQCNTVLALKSARRDQRAKATLGLGEAWLLENRSDQARTEFTRALELSSEPGWAGTVQLALARASAQERNDVAARATLTQLLATPNLDGLLRFNARALQAALNVAPRIRPDHPRLFFNADTWPAVKARIERDAQGFKRLQQTARALPAEPQVKDWGRDLMDAALVYRVSGDAALLAKIRRMLRATIEHYLLLQDFNSHVETRVGCAAALDWVWNDLPPAERDALAHDLLRYAYGRHVQDVLQGVGAVDHDPYYYAGNMHWYVGLAVLQPRLSATDRLRALTVLGCGYDNNVVASFGRRIELMKDHGAVTRVDYSLIDLPTPAWTFLHCWQSAVGPIPDEWTFASGFAPSYVLRNALGFTNNFQGQPCFRHFGYAGAWRARGGWITARLLYENLGQFIYFFSKSQPEEAAIAACLRQRMEQAGCVGQGNYPMTPYLLDLSAAPAPQLPEGLPVARYYAAPGLVLMSSGFDAHATRALFACGGGAFSDHFDAGHFTIFKQGYLALDSGTRALSQGNPDGENYDNQSVAHNTVLIRMPDETLPYRVLWSLPLKANSGGQCKLPTFAKPLAFENNHLLAYAATDATATYHTNKCERMVRQFLCLPPDHFVVFDRVVSKNANYPKTWLLHTAGEPTFTGREFRADQDGGRIFCRTFYPQDAVLEKLGGPGKEFWADGRNWPVPASSPYLRQVGMTSPADVPENMGRWRVEVKPGSARTEDVFLHLIQVADQTMAKMAECRVSEKGGQIELTFANGARAYTILLNKTGAIGGHIRIEESGKTIVDQELTREIQPQSGLAINK